MSLEGYREDAKGNLVPEAKVRPEDALEDEVVRRLCQGAIALSESLGAFKGAALDETASFRSIVAEKYGAKKGGAKGNLTLRSYDGRLEVKVAVQDSLSFGAELQAAKELIDGCVERWSEGADVNLRVLVNDAFQVNQEGRIDTGRVLGLRRLSIEDEEWASAMEAISNAVRVTSSKTYLRFYQRDPDTGARTPIALDVAAV